MWWRRAERRAFNLKFHCLPIYQPHNPHGTKRTGEGTGLGLSTAYGIIKQTGGYIFVDSIKDQGTQFTLFFPVNTQVEAEAAAAITAR